MGSVQSNSLQETTTDFMIHGYTSIREPLKLTGLSQQWVRKVYESVDTEPESMGLVLGATSWMAALLAERYGQVVVADISPSMLRLATEEIGQYASGDSLQSVKFVESNWFDLPPALQALDIVAGDNSFSFLPYPDGWVELCETLADRMRPEARLIMRVLSVPSTHRALSADEIIDKFDAEGINFTEVRTTMLFAHWNPATYGIDTEAVSRTFERNRTKLDRLLRLSATKDNDLVTVLKYKGSGAVYYAPPLGKVLALVGKFFRVASVHFGPYCMSDYFPLIVASRL